MQAWLLFLDMQVIARQAANNFDPAKNDTNNKFLNGRKDNKHHNHSV
jgi:hypothetical protein